MKLSKNAQFVTIISRQKMPENVLEYGKIADNSFSVISYTLHAIDLFIYLFILDIYKAPYNHDSLML